MTPTANSSSDARLMFKVPCDPTPPQAEEEPTLPSLPESVRVNERAVDVTFAPKAQEHDPRVTQVTCPPDSDPTLPPAEDFAWTLDTHG